MVTKYKVGWAGHRLTIDPAWRVLDVGSGHHPFARADVLLELLIDDDSQRSGAALDSRDPRLVVGDALHMPFADNEFDYVIASHLAEHVDDPIRLLGELSRVAPRGYIETPGWLGDIIMREAFHRWRVHSSAGRLVFEEVPEASPLGRFADVLYALIYAGATRPGRRTLQARSAPLRAILTATRYWFAGLFRLPFLRRAIYLCYEWHGEVACEVKRTSEPAPTPPPSESGVAPN